MASPDADGLTVPGRIALCTFDLMVLVLILVGILYVYSTGYVGEDWQADSPWRKQVVWAVLGLATYVFVGKLDCDGLRPLSLPAYLWGILLLVLVLFFGIERYGAQRWLSVVGWTVQPSEFAKSATILFLAAWLADRGDRECGLGTLLAAAGIALLPFVLIVVEPSLGAALTLAIPASVMIGVSLLSARWLVVVLAFGTVFGTLLLCLLFTPGALGLGEESWKGVLKGCGMKDYQITRVESFVNREGWNELQSRIGVATGGLTGKGYLQGTQKSLGYLPRTVAPTDFIFTVIAEESGFLGACVILCLYAGIVVFVLETAIRTCSPFARRAAIGTAVLLTTHVFVNIGMTIGLLPVTGLPLPLLSYGGSFMVCTLALLGFVRAAAREAFAGHPPQPPSASARPPRRSGHFVQLQFKF